MNAPTPMPRPGDTVEAMTVLLRAWHGGDSDAFGRVVAAMQGEFMRMAGSRLRGHDAGHGRRNTCGR